jgi:UTP--glucose-1-phosphate uridylyltransferase
MRPLSDAVPKELLPLGRKTALQHLVSELAAAGIERIVFVTSPTKETVLRGAFGYRDKESGVEYQYALQQTMRGLGDAILQAQTFVPQDEPVLVALGDAVMGEPTPGGLTGRLLESCASDARTVGLAVQQVPPEKILRYGIVDPVATGNTGDGTFFAIRGS